MKHLIIYHANGNDGFGGGGHKNAAGFVLNLTGQEDLWSRIL